MSNAIVTVIMTALLLVGVSILADGSFTAVGNVSDSWKQMEVRSVALARTDISVIDTSYASSTLDVTLKNIGGEALRDYGMWDVVVQYYEDDGTYHTRWLPYTTATPVGDNEWGKAGLYVDAAALEEESYQPEIMDPSEELILRLRVSPTVDEAANNVFVIGTPNGVTVSGPF